MSTNLQGRAVAVTGATGFLGRHLVDELIERGARVIGLVRNPDRVPSLAARGVELRRADLTDKASLARGLAGVDLLVSNAALFSLEKSGWDEHLRTNLDGTRNLLEAAIEVGIKRVVHVSSVAVYRRRLLGVINEDSAQLGEHDRGQPRAAYGVSKARSEQLAWRLTHEAGVGLSCVRPCAIYGAFDPNFTPRLRSLFGGRVAVVPAFCHFPLVYAGDVARAAVACLKRDTALGRSYNLAPSEESLGEVARAFAAAGEPVARWWLRFPLPIPMRFDSERARVDLGWRPTPAREAVVDLRRREAAG
jgi:dihydroflavonol-4-reductase